MMLTAESICVYHGDKRALVDVSLSITDNSSTAIIGHNGAGKSTLAGALCGLNNLRSGRIIVNGMDVSKKNSRWFANAGIRLVPQDVGVFKTLTVKENLEMGASVTRENVQEGMEFVLNFFPDLNCKLNDPAGSMSGGQQKMLAVGIALMSFPKVLIMDEPFIGLSPTMVDAVLKCIIELKKARELSVILIEQNIKKALSVVENVCVLKNGILVGEYSSSAILEEGNFWKYF